jgi:hypothetical protein
MLSTVAEQIVFLATGKKAANVLAAAMEAVEILAAGREPTRVLAFASFAYAVSRNIRAAPVLVDALLPYAVEFTLDSNAAVLRPLYAILSQVIPLAPPLAAVNICTYVVHLLFYWQYVPPFLHQSLIECLRFTIELFPAVLAQFPTVGFLSAQMSPLFRDEDEADGESDEIDRDELERLQHSILSAYASVVRLFPANSQIAAIDPLAILQTNNLVDPTAGSKIIFEMYFRSALTNKDLNRIITIDPFSSFFEGFCHAAYAALSIPRRVPLIRHLLLRVLNEDLEGDPVSLSLAVNLVAYAIEKGAFSLDIGAAVCNHFTDVEEQPLIQIYAYLVYFAARILTGQPDAEISELFVSLFPALIANGVKVREVDFTLFGLALQKIRPVLPLEFGDQTADLVDDEDELTTFFDSFEGLPHFL